jgi:hypothetical protein
MRCTCIPAHVALLAAMWAYISFEQSKGPSARDRVRVLLERAFARFPETVELWVELIRHTEDSEICGAVDVHGCSCASCPHASGHAQMHSSVTTPTACAQMHSSVTTPTACALLCTRPSCMPCELVSVCCTPTRNFCSRTILTRGQVQACCIAGCTVPWDANGFTRGTNNICARVLLSHSWVVVGLPLQCVS